MADMAGAVEASRKALLCRPGQPAAHVTLGSAYFALGDVENALACYRQALEFNPDYPDALFHIGLIDLMLGRYREGWIGFEQRFRRGRYRTARACEPAWDGTPLHGRTLLIMREQGLGDEIMFASCYPELIDSAAHCHIECEPRLEKLFVRSFPGATFHPLRDVQTLLQTDPGCPVDVRSYAGSLPHRLRNAPGDFPRHQGYLKADPARLDFWRARLAGLGAGLKVGLSWRGGTAFTHRERRTLSLEQLLPVLSVPGVRWINLQYGKRADELVQLAGSHGITVADWPEAIDGDYDETAALVGALDLVISACTSIVHLTGALSKPAWVMTAFVPEWRYGLHQESMPWYPSVRLFRQTAQGVWDPVILGIEQTLQQKVSEGAYNRPAIMT